MRTKDEIMNEVKEDFSDGLTVDSLNYYVKRYTLEVLIDIRDSLQKITRNIEGKEE